VTAGGATPVSDVDQPVFDRSGGDNVFKAKSADINARLVSGTVQDDPVIETVVKLVAASAQAWHPAAAIPPTAP